MKDNQIEDELSSIRNLMERSTKFISLSGLSGIMAGIYALIGAWIAREMIIGRMGLLFESRRAYIWIFAAHYDYGITALAINLIFVATTILILSIVTALVLSSRKARKNGVPVWTKTSRLLVVNASIPLIAGGIFCFLLVLRGDYAIVGATTLIFYGLALVNGSYHTFADIKYLGICEIVLGLISAILPGHGLIFWAIGFGALHIVYGAMMYFKYDR